MDCQQTVLQSLLQKILILNLKMKNYLNQMTVHSHNHLVKLYYQNQSHCHTHRTLHHRKLLHCQQDHHFHHILHHHLIQTHQIHYPHHQYSQSHFRLHHTLYFLRLLIRSPVPALQLLLLPLLLPPVLQPLPQPVVLPLLLLRFFQLPISEFQLSVPLTDLHILSPAAVHMQFHSHNRLIQISSDQSGTEDHKTAVHKKPSSLPVLLCQIHTESLNYLPH